MEKQVFSWRAKKVQICCILSGKAGFLWRAKKCKFVALLRGKAGFLVTRQKGANLLRFKWKSRFSHDGPKRCKFVALLRGKAGFLVTRQKVANLLHFKWKSRFFRDATKNNVYIRCIITFRSRCSRDALKTLIFVALLHVKAGFLMTRLKGCKFNALLHGKAGFLTTRQKLYIWGINTWKSRFSHDATENKAYICCIDTFPSRFSHDAQRLLYLMHYYVEEQVFSWRAKKVQICCIITWKSRFFHDAPKTLIIDALIREKAGFLMTRPKKPGLYDALLRLKASFLVTRLKRYISCFTMWKSRFSPNAPKVKMCMLMYYFVVKQFSHGAPNYHYIWYIFSLKTTFFRDARDKKKTRVYLIYC